MKIYYHPASVTSLAVLQFCSDEGIAFDPVVVDILGGEQQGPDFLKLNPWGLVPVLEDDGLVVTESSAIIKYLADKVGSSLYPDDPGVRARIHAQMDAVNTQVYRELAFHLVYPQVFPHHHRRSDEAQDVTVSWGLERAEKALQILDTSALADTPFLCGDKVTIADVFAACLIDVGALVGCDLERFPRLNVWLTRMKRRPGWAGVHEVFDGMAASLEGRPFVRIGTADRAPARAGTHG